MTPEEIKTYISEQLQAAIAGMTEEVISKTKEFSEAAKAETTKLLDDAGKRIAKGLEALSKQGNFHEARLRVLEKLKPVKEEKKLVAEVNPVIKAPLEIPKTTFTVDGRQFRFTLAKFNLPKVGTVTAEEALKDIAILKQLVEMGAGVIREVF